MAETSGDGNYGSSWLGSWIQSAKEKSAEAISFVKRDLAEFTTTMQDDSARVAVSVKEKLTQENATQATEKVRQGVSSLLGGISKALVVQPSDNYRPARIIGGEAVVFDRQKARLHALQTNPTTYTDEPKEDKYLGEWTKTFSVDSKKGEISELLVSNVEVRALYTQLVPITVSNVDFWCRYYYRLFLLEEDEERRRELKKRAELSCRQSDDDNIDWDSEEDAEDDEINTATSGTTTSSSHAVSSSEVCQASSFSTGTSSTDHSPVGSSDSKLSDDPKTPEKSPVTSAEAASEKTPAVIADKLSLSESAAEKFTPASGNSSFAAENKNSDMPSVPTLSVSSKTSGEISENRSASKEIGSIQNSPVADIQTTISSAKNEKNEESASDATSKEPTVSNKIDVKSLEICSSNTNNPEKKFDDLKKEQKHLEAPNFTENLMAERQNNSVASEEKVEGNAVILTEGSASNASARTTPSDTKESTDDDWEKDFDVEISDAELKSVHELARSRAAAAVATESTRNDDKVEDWEEW